MKCPKCGNEVESNTEFCTNCGEKVKKSNKVLGCSLIVVGGFVLAVAIFVLCVVLNLVLGMYGLNGAIKTIISIVQFVIPVLIILLGIPTGILVVLLKK